MMRTNKKLILPFLFLLIAFTPTLKAQVDTVFWFAAPWVTPDHADNKPMAFRISTFSQVTTVRIQQPASTYDTTFQVSANSLYSKFLTHLLTAGVLETKPANVVKQTGFKITSDFPITVVYDFLSTGNNPETYSLKGQNGMGTEFVTPFQTLWNNVTLGTDVSGDGTIEQPYADFAIVATENNTTVWIKPHCDVVGGHPANTTFSVTLNEGETYLVQNNTRFSSNLATNLSGSVVVSDKPVSVTVNDDSVNPAGGGGCYDLMGDQIVPTDVIGKEYIVNKGFLNAGSNESSFIVATQDYTTITIDDGVTTTTQLINSGETYQYSITQPLTHIVADKNVYVIHASGYGCELGEAILPPLNCSGSGQVSFTRTTNTNFLLDLLCHTGDEGAFTINGSAALVPASSFTVVPGTGGQWMGAQIPYTAAQIPVNAAQLIVNSSGFFSMGVIDGSASGGCLYHYMSSFIRRVYTNAGVDQTLCSGLNPIPLSGSVTGGATTGIWTVLNGTGSFDNSTSFTANYLPSSSDTAQGSVTIVLASTGNCDPVMDTMVVTFKPTTKVNAGTDVNMCTNNMSTITLSGSIANALGATWSSLGSGASFSNSGSLNTTYTPSAAILSAGSDTVLLTTSGNIYGCPDVSDTLVLSFINPPLVNAGGDATVCANNDTVPLIGLVDGASMNGVWSTYGSGDFVPSDTTLSGGSYIPSSSDTLAGSVIIYLSSVNNGICNVVQDSIIVTILSAPSVAITTNNVSCGASSISLTGNVTSGFSVVWNTPNGTGTIANANSQSTSYTPSGGDILNGFVDFTLSTAPGSCSIVKDSLHVDLATPPSANAGGNQSVCSNANVPLNGVVSGVTNSGIWTSTGTGSFVLSQDQLTNTYVPSVFDIGSTVELILTSTNNQGCTPSQDSISISFMAPPTAYFTATEACAVTPTIFSDNSLAPSGETITAWDWDFGDASTHSVSTNPIHSYVGYGTYTATLVATASNGCSDATTVVVTVDANPLSNFSSTTPCQGDETEFSDLSTIPQGSITQWLYTFGDQTSNATQQNPVHTYAATGFFPVTLVVTSDKGCSNSITQNINVLPQPAIGFGISSNPGLAGESLTFNDVSGGGPVSWDWDFGDTTGTNVQNPAHVYTSGGIYPVTLTIADQYGCTNTMTQELVIAMLPALPTAFTPNSDGENDIFIVRGGPFKNILFKVYNNWGELIFSSNQQSEGWDGNYKGVAQAMGVYVWYVEVEVADGRVFKQSGDVTLLR